MKCETINYRKGFLEVTPAIHDQCVNIELWEIDAETNISDARWVDDIPGTAVVSNCELEMTTNEARRLVEALLAALERINPE